MTGSGLRRATSDLRPIPLLGGTASTAPIPGCPIWDARSAVARPRFLVADSGMTDPAPIDLLIRPRRRRRSARQNSCSSISSCPQIRSTSIFLPRDSEPPIYISIYMNPTQSNPELRIVRSTVREPESRLGLLSQIFFESNRSSGHIRTVLHIDLPIQEIPHPESHSVTVVRIFLSAVGKLW